MLHAGGLYARSVFFWCFLSQNPEILSAEYRGPLLCGAESYRPRRTLFEFLRMSEFLLAVTDLAMSLRSWPAGMLVCAVPLGLQVCKYYLL